MIERQKNLMIYSHHLDDYLTVAKYFRNIALSIDAEPENILDHIHHPFMDNLLAEMDSTCLQRVQQFEALSYGDPGVLLACPGPSLSGLMVKELGNPEQIKYYHEQLVKRRARTCLAVTEPRYGSEANQMQTSLTVRKNKYYLNGTKWLVGNGAVAELGVLIARSHAGPLGIRAILLTPDQLHSACVERVKLPMLGLRGAQLSYLSFHDCPIEQDCILGDGLKDTKKGMLALVKTFNRMRPCVAALALGLSHAVLGYIAEPQHRLKCKNTKLFNQLLAELLSIRKIVHSAAAIVDKNASVSAPSSFAKIMATRFAEKIFDHMHEIILPGAIGEHPLLLKWQRDALGFEYMEGTENIQKRHIFTANYYGQPTNA